MRAIFPQFRWKTESREPQVDPRTYVSQLSGEAFVQHFGGYDTVRQEFSAVLTAAQKDMLTHFWQENRAMEFTFQWCADGEAYTATWNQSPRYLPTGTMWRTRFALNLTPELDE